MHPTRTRTEEILLLSGYSRGFRPHTTCFSVNPRTSTGTARAATAASDGTATARDDRAETGRTDRRRGCGAPIAYCVDLFARCSIRRGCHLLHGTSPLSRSRPCVVAFLRHGCVRNEVAGGTQGLVILVWRARLGGIWLRSRLVTTDSQ